MAHFILEIGVEEMPARFLSALDQELAERFAGALQDVGLAAGPVRTASTPRRLVVDIADVAAMQKKEEVVVSGPPARIALDSEGKPTKAGLGFAASQGVPFEQVYVEQTEKGEYLALKKTVGGRPAAEILGEICHQIVPTLTFPKKMQWIGRECTFGRPVRWILALLDAAVVPFAFAGLQASSQTCGHRVLGPGPFHVPHADAYAGIVRGQGHVSLQAAERKAAIRTEGERLAAEIGATVAWSEALLDQVANLVETPCSILGKFDEKFLALPEEVLLTSMQVHQKSFGLRGPDGTLLPYFLTAANIISREPALVRKGWERVLRARLEDARFFWEADSAARFDTWLDKLDKVVFIGPLGSMGDKSRRLAALAPALATLAGSDCAADLKRAGRLAKADLVSEMVYEFDDLQGIMGGIYARQKGESDVVALALAEQYLPAGADSPLPSSLPGALLSLADKLDNLVGCFGLGMMPTGAADPYALRRNALGVIRIILDHGLHVSLRVLLEEAQSNYSGVQWKCAPEEALNTLCDFFTQRLRAFWGGHGVETVILDAALAVGCDDMTDTWARVQALMALSQEPEFEASVLTFKRVANIIRKQADAGLSGQVDTSLFEHDAERTLWSVMITLEPEWVSLAADRNYPAMLAMLQRLKPAVDGFFDQVMVMCEDQTVRSNRLNMLLGVLTPLSQVADFGKLQV